MLRVDEEITYDLDKDDEKQLISIITKLLKQENINAVIFQDYNKGINTTNLIQKIISTANDLNIPVIVDPKKKNFNTYKNVTLFKPNLKELKEGLNIDFNVNNINELANATHLLHKNQNIKMVLTTLSEAGVFISSFTKDNKFITHSIPAHVRSVADVSGAGDTVISVASLFLSLNLPPDIIASISNLAGGIVCEEVGVVPINKEKLMNEVLKMFN
jgi:rfaE bifunctional protein kinase chain/domain